MISPDGATLATGGSQGYLDLWDLTTGELRATLKHPGRVHVEPGSFSPDGTMLATIAVGLPRKIPEHVDSQVIIRDVGAGRKLATLDIWSGASDALFSPDGKTLAVSGQRDKTDPRYALIQLWDVPTLLGRR